MSHLESGSVVWVRLGQAWWPGTITTVAKCPPEFVQAIRKTPIAIVKFFHENEYQDVHKEEHIFPYNCDRKEEFIRKGQAVNKNQSHGDVDLLAKFEADVVTAEKLTGGDMDILRSLVEGADTYKAYHHTHCPPTSPGLDSNNMVISGQPSQPLLASPCPAGVDFESRPQESLWPERVEAHTRLDCNTSKVRNPQNCQAASSDHQIALLSRDLPSPVVSIAGRDLEQAHPNLGRTSLISKHYSSIIGEEEKPAAQQRASSSYDVKASFIKELANGEDPSPANKVTPSEVKDEEVLDDEEEEEEEEEEDSLNHELHYESERFAESVDEDSLNLDFEMEGEEDEPEPLRPASEGEGEAIESESESDPLYEVEDEEDGSLAMLGTEQDGLVGPADEDEDSLIPDIEMESEEEDGELSERIAQTHLPQSWETDEDDSEEDMYHNLPSASATDEEEVGWVNNGAEKENKGPDQLLNPNLTQLQEIVEDKGSSSKEAEGEECSSEKEAICQEGKESFSSDRVRSLSKSKPLEEATILSQEAFLEPLTQEANHKHHHRRDQDKEEEQTHMEENESKPNSHTPSNPQIPCSTKTNHYQDKGPLEDNISNQDSKDPTTLTLSVLESPSTSKLSDNSLNFEGFDREKTRQASARLLMLLKVRYLQPLNKPQSWKPKTAPRRRGRPSLRGRIGSVRGKRSGNVLVRRKRSQRAVSTTTSTTSDTDEGQEEEIEGAVQGSIGGRSGRSGSGWIKRRRARGRPNKRKIKHSSLRKKTLHRQRKNTENSVEKRKTRSSDKEREDEATKTTRKSRDPYERFAHSPDITSFSEAKPRQPRNWGGTRGVEDRAGQYVPSGDPPVKRARKRKPSEVDNLLQWAVETGHTGTRNRGPRERHHSVTSISTTSNNNITNNNNNNLATRRSRLETKMANKEQKKRGRKKKVKTDTEEEKEEDEGLGKQSHTHSSSDDPLMNSEEELSDTGKGRGRLVYPYKSGDLVWVQLEGHWWPAYVDQVYPQTKRVSIYRVGIKQEASTKVDLGRVRSFQFGEVPAFVDRSESGFTEAFQVTESFCLLRNHGNKISAHKFFTMPPEEQDALIIVSFTPKDDPALSTPPGKRTRGSVSEEPQSKSQKGWFYEPLNSDSEDGMGTREDRYEMSARDRRKMQKSLRSRRRENEKLIKFMNSAACMDHLWQIFSGQKQCERHKLYQSEATRRSLLWSGIGPFQLDQDDDQILSVVDFLHTEMNKKQPDFNLAQDYVFKVWMPEAIKEALRVVLKVPEDMLELALDEGYRESLTDRNTRRLDFL